MTLSSYFLLSFIEIYDILLEIPLWTDNFSWSILNLDPLIESILIKYFFLSLYWDLKLGIDN